MQKTDLNTSPYYDDFDENKDFHRVLFRPGFSVQARELTQLQSILQKQVGNFGKHFFKDGTVVIPGQAAYAGRVYGVKINLDSLTSEEQSTLISAYQTALTAGDVVIQDEDPSGSVNEDTVIRANIIHIEEPTADDPLILYLQYVKAGGSNSDQTEFSDNTVLYSTPVSGTLDNVSTATTSASIQGSLASIERGVYFIREHFVRVAEQKIVLEKYSSSPSVRIGLSITEDILTPEEDTSLLDNAQGTTNFNAKGAHRLKISLTLAKKDLGSTDDENFVELISVKNGLIQTKARSTEYSVLAETLARRTFDESGDYLIKPFSFDLRENLDNGFNNGLYETGQTTDSGNTASESLFNLIVSPGKGYVNGYETELISKSFIDFEKARDIEIVDGVSTPVEIGNYVLVTNTFGAPTLSFSGQQPYVPYTNVNLHDSFTNSKAGGTSAGDAEAARGVESSSQTTADGGPIGIARVRGFEQESGTYTNDSNFHNSDDILDSDSQHKLYLFDVNMVTELQMSDDLAASLNQGDKVIGLNSGASGFVQRTSGNDIYLISTVGTFESGEKLKTTTESSTVVNNILVDNVSSPTELTVSNVKTFSLNQVKSIFGQIQSVSGSYVLADQDVFSADIISTLTTNNANQNETNVDRLSLSGTISVETDTDVITGSGTKFQTELVVGDILEIATGDNGASEFIQIDTITSDTSATYFVVKGKHIRPDSVLTQPGSDNTVTFTNTGIGITRFTSGTVDSRKMVIGGNVNEEYNGLFTANYGSNDTFTFEAQEIGNETSTGISCTTVNTTTTVTTADTSSLVVGMRVTGTGIVDETHIVSIVSATQFTIDKASDADGTNTLSFFSSFFIGLSSGKSSIPSTRVRTKVVDPNKNVLIRKLKKDFIKELDETELVYTVRKQYYETITGATESVTTTDGEFVDLDQDDYSVTVTAVDGGATTFSVGDDLDIEQVLSVSGTTLNITVDHTEITEVKIVATIRKEGAGAGSKSKTLEKAKLLLVDNSSYSAPYGTDAKHQDISLGFADIYRVHKIYESSDSNNPFLPEWTIDTSAAFEVGETIKGSTTNALGVIVRNTSGAIVYVPSSETAFISGEIITGLSSGATTTLNTLTDTTSADITSNYLVDDGQKDSFYDIGKLTLKPNKPKPTNKLLVVFDYFDHGNGNFFSVDSYTGQVDFDEIPSYSANRVDPDEPQPAGEFDLADSIDYRPRVSDRAVQSVSTINGINFNEITVFSVDSSNRFFYNTSADRTGSSTIDIMKDGTSFNYGFSKYLGRVDSLYLSPNGKLVRVKGTPAEEPTEPKKLENSMHLAIIKIPAYTFGTESITVKRIDHKRYTMKDISGIDQRMKNFEYYTALNLLEKETADLEVLDANGLNKFKSGFLVDNFSGHSIGDVGHPDYNNSIDFKDNVLRPRFSAKNIKLEEVATTDTERTSSGYQKTGDFITLPYTDVVSVQQPYASTVEKVNPVLTFAWVGTARLKPSRDEWFEVGKVQKRILEVEEGDYDHLVREQGGSPVTYQWNSWETVWSGQKLVSSSNETIISDYGLRRSQRFGRGSRTRTADRQVQVNRTVTQDIDVQVKTGLKKEIKLRLDERQVGEDKIINETPILYIRSTDDMGAEIQFTATGLKPKTKVYVFFDKKDVSSFITPTGGSRGDNLITDASGGLTGTFFIPDPKVEGNIQFETGEKTFRITSSSTNSNLNTNVATFAEGKFVASGILRDVGRDIIQTRNAEIAISNVSQKRTVNVGEPRTVDVEVPGTEEFVNWRDPLAQSFISETKTGEYITKVDTFFAAKDDQNIPVSLQVREMENGYPTQRILPLGVVTLNPDQVNISSDASEATTFTFESPLYIKGGTEYCIVLISDSNKYTAWISRVGEVDVGGTRYISEQPYLGVLFKSQNSSTWNATQSEDLKFTIYRAKFDTSSVGNLVFSNGAVPKKKLGSSPFQSFNNTETFAGSDPAASSYRLSKNLDDYNIGTSNTARRAAVIADIDGKVVTPTFTDGETITLTDTTLSCDTTNTDATVTVATGTTADLIVGMTVTGSGIPGSTTISSITSSTEFELSQAATATASGVSLTFGALPSTATLTVRFLIDKIKVTHEDHHMYQSTTQNTSGPTKSNYVTFQGVTGDQSNSILTIDTSSAQINDSGGTTTLDISKSYIVPATTGSSSLFKVESNSSGGISSVSILNPGSGFTASASLTLDFSGVTTGNTVTTISGITISTVGDTLFGVPIALLNGSTGIEIKDFGMDYYTFSPTLTSYSISSISSEKIGGGTSVEAEENVQFNLLKLMIPTIEYNDTSIEAQVKTTSGLSPGLFDSNISSQAFTLSSNYSTIKLDENNDFLSPKLIASPINQDENMSGKSMFVRLVMKSETEFLSPIIDLDSRSVIAIANRFSNIDSSANVYPKSTYISPTQPEGDSGETIYITRKVQLETPARSIKVYFDGLRQTTSEFQVLYKILHSDETLPFDDIGWKFFNNGSTSGTNSDVNVNANENYLEYSFEDTDLDEFVAFSIKIRMQGTNTSDVPKIRNLRVLALAT